MKFRKKPVEVDAWPIRELVDNHKRLKLMPELVHLGMMGERPTLTFATNGIYIKTLEGGMFGGIDDILIMGVKGEFYPCKPDIFAATYEKTEGEKA